MKKTLQNGFAHLGALLLVVIVVLISLIGYKVWNDRNATVSSTTPASMAQQIPAINNTSDLNKAQSTLNNENVDGDLNPDSLNDDVSSLL